MIFGKATQTNPEQFLALNIFPKSCILTTFAIEESEIKVENFTFYHFTESENLTEVAKQFFQQKLGLKSELKIVFGLPSFWIEGQKVKPEFERLLLKVAEDLKLTPLAFVSTLAAVGFYKYHKDSSLTNFYILQVFEQKIEAAKFENGEVSQLKVEDFHDLNSFDFSKIFGQDQPTTIFIFAEENFDNLKDSLEQFFTQRMQPQILEVVKLDFAQSLATATAFDLGKLPKKIPETGINVQEFGFAKEKDVGEIAVGSQKISVFEEKEAEKQAARQIFKTTLPKFYKLLSGILAKFGFRKTSLAIFGFLVVIFVTLVVFWFLPSAQVEVQVRSSPFSKDFEIKAAPTAGNIDSQNLIIPAQVLSVEKVGNKKTVTSGRKLVGEKAQGVVTVFNKTAAAKTFPTGTLIVGPSNLKFVLAATVTVASRSATLEGITFGKNKVKVESLEIGEAANLPAGTDFTFADFDNSLYSAHSDESFTGGSQKEVNVVSIDDRKRLEEELTKELKEAAKRDLVQMAAGLRIEDGAILVKPEKLQFDKEVGVEANILTLTARISFNSTVYSAADIDKLISEKLKGELPPSLTNWQNAATETKISKVENDGTLKIKTSFAADLIPEINKEELVKAISGKSVDFAKNHILNLPEVKGVNMKVSPRLPNFLGNLPRSKSKIKVVIIAAKANE